MLLVKGVCSITSQTINIAPITVQHPYSNTTYDETNSMQLQLNNARTITIKLPLHQSAWLLMYAMNTRTTGFTVLPCGRGSDTSTRATRVRVTRSSRSLGIGKMLTQSWRSHELPACSTTLWATIACNLLTQGKLRSRVLLSKPYLPHVVLTRTKHSQYTANSSNYYTYYRFTTVTVSVKIWTVSEGM